MSMASPSLAVLPTPPAGTAGWPWQFLQPQEKLQQELGPWPRVSIITPSYNQAEFLEKTIRSVLLQGYPDLEYIIIDGGSTDGSVEIIRKYEPWLAYWVSEPDRGQSEAINKGFRRTTGQVIAWLNSDDIYHPGVLHKAVWALEENRARLVCSRCRLVAPGGRLVGMYAPTVPVTTRSLIMTWESSYPSPPQPTVFFGRDVLDQTGLLDESLHYALDYEYWLRAIQHFSFCFVDDVWADYLVHPASKTGQGWRPFARETFEVGCRYWHVLKWEDRLRCRLAGWRRINAQHHLNDAYDAYRSGDVGQSWRSLRTAVWFDPFRLLHRGTLSFCLRLLSGPCNAQSDVRER